MNPLSNLWRRLRSFGQRRAVKQEIDDELRFHVEQRTAKNIEAGMSPEEAAREARRRFGNVQRVREECRELRGANFGEVLIQDVRFGARMLCKNRGFTLVAVLTLALGIGANTSMFSLLNLLLFRPGPYPEPGRLVTIFRTSPQSQTWPHSAAELLDYREQNKSFEKLAFFSWEGGYNLAKPGEPAERLSGIRATADLFPTLGVNPLLGRVFDAEEDQPGHGVVVLGYGCWRRDFGADTNVIGRTIRLDGESVSVIGVMPANFDYPLLWGHVDVWRPLALTPEQRRDRGFHHFHAFGRLKPGISRLQAEAEMKAICARLPDHVPHNSVRLVPLMRSGSPEEARRMLYFSFGLAAVVLLIACANLANLQLARAAERWREFAVRSALGASRVRLMRQLLTESLLVSAAGGAFGILLAYFLNGFLGRHIPLMDRSVLATGRSMDVPLDVRVLVFALICSGLTGIVFGLAPAWLASRSDVNDALKEDRRGSIGGRWQNWLRQGLIIGEIALALSMLAGAGLFIGRLKQMTRIDPGWNVNGLLTGTIMLNASEYGGVDAQKAKLAFCQRLETRLRALPGIESVSFSWSLPVWGFDTSSYFTVDGQAPPKAGEELLASHEYISPAYFRTFGIGLLQGRGFTAGDTAESPGVVVVNETMARRFWPGESPVGKWIDINGEKEIVGVVNDIHCPANLGAAETPFQVFCPLPQVFPQVAQYRFLVIALRTTGDSEALAAGLRQAVAAVDADQSISDIRSAREAVAQGFAAVSLIGTLLEAFAALGLGLAAIGIYGVISYSVAQRTGELGIRMALGAQRHQVLWLVLRKGILLCLLGTLLGFGGAVAIARLLSALLPELSAANPMIFCLMTALLMVVALLACYLPARRASKMDPMTALRCE